MSTASRDLAIVAAWHEALNAGQLDELAALMDDEVEFVGPRGSGSGVALVTDWAIRVCIHLEPSRWFHRDGIVVVEERARWQAEGSGEWGEPQLLATAFLVQARRVRRLARFDILAAAMADAGLDTSNEVYGE
ncbi:MAG: nuclear transport factor 2 family protein [Thermomicrobiales bacterium]